MPALIAVFLWSSPALAACQPSTEATAHSMSYYRAFRSEEAELRAHLESTAVKCRAEGEAVSARAARAAEARSCQAQREAGALESETRALGERCSEEYNALLKRQKALKARFLPVHADLVAGIKVIDSDRALFRRFCAEDMDVADKMAEAFLALSLQIDSAGTLAQKGSQDYAALAGTAERLAAFSGRHLEACGTADATLLPLASAPAAAGGPAPARVSSRPAGSASDLTGTDKAIEAAREAQALIERVP